MNTVTAGVRNTPAFNAYIEQNLIGTRMVRNSANFLIRNCMSGLSKRPEERTSNENACLIKVGMCIREANRQKDLRLAKKLDELSKLPQTEKTIRDIENVRKKASHFRYPEAEKWMLSYELIDAIMKLTKDEAYYNCTSQVNQQAIKKTCASWKSYFNSLRQYKVSPQEFTGMPRIPAYIKTNGATAHFTNQVCRFSQRDNKTYLNFANFGEVCVGTIPVKGRYVKTEVKPYGDSYRLLITFDDGQSMPEIPDEPERIMGIDFGVSNFMACATNTGSRPFIIDGRWLKSENQWFNKTRANLVSKLTEGTDPHNKTIRRTSRRLVSMSRRRDDVLRDYFYKVAHYICRRAEEQDVQVIVVGHNKGQKDSISIGDSNNQNFTGIPYTKMISYLRCVAAKYDIPIVVREESYTSQADMFSDDPIPTYIGNDDTKYTFSGKRSYRGLYQTGDGSVVNADINAAANILRKEYPNAFVGMKDKSYLQSVRMVRREELKPNHKKKVNP